MFISTAETDLNNQFNALAETATNSKKSRIFGSSLNETNTHSHTHTNLHRETHNKQTHALRITRSISITKCTKLDSYFPR